MASFKGMSKLVRLLSVGGAVVCYDWLVLGGAVTFRLLYV